MFKNTFRALPALAIALTMIVALVPAGMAFANDADITLTSVMQEGEPITFYLTDNSQISTLDPQRASDSVSIEMLENLFLGLTNTDPVVPGGITAEMATEWTTSDDGLVWTFTIRNDVPWVRWDPVTDTAEVLRNVTAYDFEYGIKRACDPRLAAYYSEIGCPLIKGGMDWLSQAEDEATDEGADLIQVEALDDSTLVVNLEFPAGYFFSMTPMWMFRAVPQEIIEEYGDDWTELGNLTTNGPFVLDEWVRGVRRVMLKNELMPADLRGPGNVERVIYTIVEDAGTIFALYQDSQIDISGVPSAEVQSVLNDEAYAEELVQKSDSAVFYLAFAHDKAPFDDVHARRAFSATIDRNAFVQEIQQGRGIPMIHFTPPGMFGAPPVNKVGVGYDPAFALSEIEAAGYPNCEGFPNINIVTYASAGTWAEFLAASVERELGCDPSVFTIEQQEFSVLLETVSKLNATEDRPNMWSLGWGPDYGDANNWVHDVLSCESENDFMRPCTEVDDLLTQAARESDPDTRIELYERIEEKFFGPEGDTPIIPLYLRVGYTLLKPWLSYDVYTTDGIFGGPHRDWVSIDQAAQMAARG
ncbi:MAG: peptide ABC transporter substrate-binding protein [Anaerolineae bacterium]|nr:peptide ABC transporter substrate-binding protein [Anaerolineae bacterium]